MSDVPTGSTVASPKRGGWIQCGEYTGSPKKRAQPHRSPGSVQQNPSKPLLSVSFSLDKSVQSGAERDVGTLGANAPGRARPGAPPRTRRPAPRAQQAGCAPARTRPRSTCVSVALDMSDVPIGCRWRRLADGDSGGPRSEGLGAASGSGTKHKRAPACQQASKYAHTSGRASSVSRQK